MKKRRGFWAWMLYEYAGPWVAVSSKRPRGLKDFEEFLCPDNFKAATGRLPVAEEVLFFPAVEPEVWEWC